MLISYLDEAGFPDSILTTIGVFNADNHIDQFFYR